MLYNWFVATVTSASVRCVFSWPKIDCKVEKESNMKFLLLCHMQSSNRPILKNSILADSLYNIPAPASDILIRKNWLYLKKVIVTILYKSGDMLDINKLRIETK